MTEREYKAKEKEFDKLYVEIDNLLEDNSKIYIQHDSRKKEFVDFDAKLFYTPTVEEFHQGFEYYMIGGYGHIANKNIWIHNVLAYGEFTDETDSFIETYIERGDILVKKLDRKDIESCGLIVAPIDLGQDTNENELGIYKKEVNLAGSLYGAFYIDSTVHNANIELFDTFFMIKNKSEFKRLLQQMNVT